MGNACREAITAAIHQANEHAHDEAQQRMVSSALMLAGALPWRHYEVDAVNALLMVDNEETAAMLAQPHPLTFVCLDWCNLWEPHPDPEADVDRVAGGLLLTPERRVTQNVAGSLAVFAGTEGAALWLGTAFIDDEEEGAIGASSHLTVPEESKQDLVDGIIYGAERCLSALTELEPVRVDHPPTTPELLDGTRRAWAARLN